MMVFVMKFDVAKGVMNVGLFFDVDKVEQVDLSSYETVDDIVAGQWLGESSLECQ